MCETKFLTSGKNVADNLLTSYPGFVVKVKLLLGRIKLHTKKHKYVISALDVSSQLQDPPALPPAPIG
jgi:hypothetical protein